VNVNKTVESAKHQCRWRSPILQSAATGTKSVTCTASLWGHRPPNSD